MMRIVKSILTGLMVAIAMLAISSTVFAEEMSTEQPAYINGGIGQEEADDMRANAGQYNLRLYFSEAKQGQSISDVAVTVTDKKGNVKLEIADAGPMLFMHMENGTYKVVCQHNGVAFTKTVKVANHKGVNVHLNWKNAMADAVEDTSDN
jgi:hypothetical protein